MLLCLVTVPLPTVVCALSCLLIDYSFVPIPFVLPNPKSLLSSLSATESLLDLARKQGEGGMGRLCSNEASLVQNDALPCAIEHQKSFFSFFFFFGCWWPREAESTAKRGWLKHDEKACTWWFASITKGKKMPFDGGIPTYLFTCGTSRTNGRRYIFNVEFLRLGTSFYGYVRTWYYFVVWYVMYVRKNKKKKEKIRISPLFSKCQNLIGWWGCPTKREESQPRWCTCRTTRMYVVGTNVILRSSTS